MEKIFLSYHFDDPDVQLIQAVQAEIYTRGLEIVVADSVGGGGLSEEVKRRIGSADACIGIATPRDALSNGKFRTHPWVESELTIARAKEKPAIAIVERSVELVGAFAENERIDYDPAHPLPALTKLAKTLGGWQREYGRPMLAVVLPTEIATQIARRIDDVRCEYRTWDQRCNKGKWRPASLMEKQAGTVVFLDGARDDRLMEIKVELDGRTWRSAAFEPFTQVQLKEV